jgi:hypothetical protein
MSPKGLFTQIGIIAISIAIIFTYIRPEFVKITDMQDDMSVYQTESGTVSKVNDDLAQKLLQLEKVTTEDRRKLFTYLPDQIDAIAVQRDLLLISQAAGVLYISSDESNQSSLSKASEESDSLPRQNTFGLSVQGTYSQIKNLFSLMEQNHYLLEVSDLSIDRIEGGFLQADMSLVVYSYKPPFVSNQIVF